ncbi:hypothetical protein POM88_044462 [Heracleum sosnowskyi]|uniref:RPW8 domain-containing protein n=1 Tax=Heracleum sosnowskyi TaxID=360622 RepID=A0AAD8M5C9_9APIA|nr:hypothetical protein POM88_044462 [Heracleum sosnowskyi]
MADAVLGSVTSELLNVAIAVGKQNFKLKSNLKTLENTLKSVKPIFDHAEKLHRVLGRPEEETEQFIKLLQSGLDLVNKCRTVSYLNKTRIGVIKNNEKLDLLHKCLSICDFSGFGAVPGAPNGVVGLDQPLKEFKEMLLKDEVRIKVISAPGGCGKTTLAKMLCHDPDFQRFPLALKVVGRSLYGHEVVKWRREEKNWSDGKSIIDTNKKLLDNLQPSLDALEEMKETSLKDCCLDLGSFPEDQRIPATTVLDIWAELYNLDDMDTYSDLLELAFRNLVNLFCTRQTGSEVDGFCNERNEPTNPLLVSCQFRLIKISPQAGFP